MTCPPSPNVTLSRVLYDLRTVLWRLVPADLRWLRSTWEDPPELKAWDARRTR